MSEQNLKPMKINILDIDKTVKENRLVPIKSAKKLDANNTIYDEGLFSEKIFGKIGSLDRMRREAYIELNCKCIQPYICIALERTSTDFTNTLLGTLRWKVNGDGTIEKSKDDSGYSGLNFIYKNFDEFIKTVIQSNGSKSREENLQLLKQYDKKLIFIDKFLVLPAGYRDINTLQIQSRGKADYDVINDYYSSMIVLSNQLEKMGEFDGNLVDERFTYQMQQNINNIYRLLMEKKTAKKSGLIQKSGLAKTISYSAGNVICNPKISRNTYDEDLSSTIPFAYLGIPSPQLLDIFYPFVLHRLKEILDYNNELIDIIKYLIKSKETDSFNDVIEKFINKCKFDKKFVFKLMKNDKSDHSIMISGQKRILNVLEFIKNEIIDPILVGRFVTATRFPVDNKLSQQYLKPIATTTETVKKYKTDDGLEYELCENEILVLALQVNSNTLVPMGGDFDWTLKQREIGA